MVTKIPRCQLREPREYAQRRSWQIADSCVVAAVGWWGVFTGNLGHFDLEIRTFIHHLASPALTASMRLVSTMGSTALLAELFVVFFIGFLLVWWREDAAWLALTMAGAAVIELTLKYSFKRPRPVPFLWDSALFV
jgi:hypothetical protein